MTDFKEFKDFKDKVHLIIDYSFLYYKYKFQLEAGKMRRLAVEVYRTYIDNAKALLSEIEDTSSLEKCEIDISQVYYSLKEIEKFIRDTKYNFGKGIVVSICFDMPTDRKEKDNYKSNRHGMNELDIRNVQIAERILNSIGYNTFRIDGLEADDIVHYLVDKYSDRFESTVIYTPDMDLAVNIKPNVYLNRYKIRQGYTFVNVNNFSEYIGTEFKCNMPYNAVMLYKSTVGDKSDCIDGIKGFGVSAFNKLVDFLTSKHINWSTLGNTDCMTIVIDTLEKLEYFKSEQLAQMRASFELVKPKDLSSEQEKIIRIANWENFENCKVNRERVYTAFKMKSLL